MVERDISGSKNSISKGIEVLQSVGPYGEELEVVCMWKGTWDWLMWGGFWMLEGSCNYFNKILPTCPVHLHKRSCVLYVCYMSSLFLNTEARSEETHHFPREPVPLRTILIIRRFFFMLMWNVSFNILLLLFCLLFFEANRRGISLGKCEWQV